MLAGGGAGAACAAGASGEGEEAITAPASSGSSIQEPGNPDWSAIFPAHDLTNKVRRALGETLYEIFCGAAYCERFAV